MIFFFAVARRGRGPYSLDRKTKRSGVVDDGFANVTRRGSTAGAGVEHMFAPDWSAFVDYDFIALGTDAVTFTPTPPATSPFAYNIKQDVHTVLVGLNYRLRGTP